MNFKKLSPIVAIVTFGVAFSAQAHDPKEHMKNNEKPNCAALKEMDTSKMDNNDPVMQAMMKQCMNNMDKDSSDHDKREMNKDHHSTHKH